MNQKLIDTLEQWLYPKVVEASILITFISSLLLLSYSVVFYTGGTYFGYVHLFYLPIVLAGFFFAFKGGLIVGFIAGILVGPFMPLVVADNIMQPLHSLLIRAIFFVLIGGVSGLGSSIFRAYLSELKHRFLTNYVTGLPNFFGLETTFHEKVQTVKDLAVVVIDIRNIEEISIAIGPGGVDELLKNIAHDLRASLPADITVGHTQAAIFNLLIDDASRVDEIVRIIQRSIKSTYLIDKIPIFVEEFFGISQYPRDADNFSELFRKARMAINFGARQAKVLAKFDDSVVDPSGENAVLLTELNQAILSDKLDIHYQPKVELKTGRVYGLEALARWYHFEKGEISPNKFIPLTERTMLINPFTKWMVERALKDLSRWKNEGFSLNLAINFSLRNFHDRALIDKVIELIAFYDIDPSLIEIEVTESAFSTNMHEVIQTLQYLRDKGIRIAIDDFGTGQASQQYLFQLPIDGLKIDRIFVNGLGHNQAAVAIVKNAISLGHQLNLKVIAEGIETEDQYQSLVKMGCDQGQGYLISAAMPYDELMIWLKSEKRYAIS